MSEKYNGWSNYETWLINNHFSGDNYLISELPSNHNSVYDYEKALENYFDEMLEQYNECASAFLSEMLSSAFGNVDYRDLAKTYYENYLKELVSIELLDTCYPDYFQGSSHYVINVSAYKEQTFYKLESELKEAFNADIGLWELELNNGKTLSDIDTDYLIELYIDDVRHKKPKNRRLNVPYVECAEKSESYHYFAIVVHR